MKILLKKIFIIIVLGNAVTAYANNDNSGDSSKAKNGMNMKWTCENNASNSGSNGDKDSSKPQSGKAAFEQAFKTCNDCNKITCASSKE